MHLYEYRACIIKICTILDMSIDIRDTFCELFYKLNCTFTMKNLRRCETDENIRKASGGSKPYYESHYWHCQKTANPIFKSAI